MENVLELAKTINADIDVKDMEDNIRSPKAHFKEFEASLLSAELKPTFIGFTETWLQQEKEA